MSNLFKVVMCGGLDSMTQR